MPISTYTIIYFLFFFWFIKFRTLLNYIRYYIFNNILILLRYRLGVLFDEILIYYDVTCFLWLPMSIILHHINTETRRQAVTYRKVRVASHKVTNKHYNYLPTYFLLYFTFADLTYLQQLQKSQLLKAMQNRVACGSRHRTTATRSVRHNTTRAEQAVCVSYTKIILPDSINGISAANNIHSFVLNYYYYLINKK